MRSKVRLSAFSAGLTIVVTLVLMVGCVVVYNDNRSGFYVISAILLFTIVLALIFSPVEVIADADFIVVKSPLKRYVWDRREVESVTRYQPTMGATRIVASGGYMGYWGIFAEGGVGKYTAFYGRSSDCFMLTMRDGRKYVLGCENPDWMVAYLSGDSDRRSIRI